MGVIFIVGVGSIRDLGPDRNPPSGNAELGVGAPQPDRQAPAWGCATLLGREAE